MATDDEMPCGDNDGGPLLTPDEKRCLSDRHWYAFLCSSLITFFAGLLLVLSWRIIAWTMCQRRQGPKTPTDGTPASAPTDGETGGGGANGVGMAGLSRSSSTSRTRSQKQMQPEPPSVVSSTGTTMSISIQPDQPSHQGSTTAPSDPEGADAANATPAQVGWVTSSQDWAGGMMSGQTTTGRIMVSSKLFDFDE